MTDKEKLALMRNQFLSNKVAPMTDKEKLAFIAWAEKTQVRIMGALQ